jgi:hypothetical protein
MKRQSASLKDVVEFSTFLVKENSEICGSSEVRLKCEHLNLTPVDMTPVSQTVLVATAGGTDDARFAGPNTAA